MNANQQTAHLTRSVEEMRSQLERGNEPHGVCTGQPRQGSAAQLRQLRTMHEGLAKGFASALSNLLRMPAEARLVGADPMAYGHFVSKIEPPACFYILAGRFVGRSTHARLRAVHPAPDARSAAWRNGDR